MFAHVLDMTCNDHASSAVCLSAAGVTTHVAVLNEFNARNNLYRYLSLLLRSKLLFCCLKFSTVKTMAQINQLQCSSFICDLAPQQMAAPP